MKYYFYDRLYQSRTGRTIVFVLIIIFSSPFFVSCQGNRFAEKQSVFSKTNLLAWCIVPFDNQNRNPIQRSKMLKELGLTKFAYDWREENLPHFEEELAVLLANGIDLAAVWFWIKGGDKQLLNENNEYILQILKKTKTKTTLWVSFNEGRVFKNLDNQNIMREAIKAVEVVYHRAKEIGCKIALYNHGGWFGQPVNQIRIIEALGYHDIGLVYNFHHAHDQIEEFTDLLQMMMPYLWTVNLNGMRPEGPKILTIGEGNRELDMLRKLKASNFQGTVGIIGHLEEENVKEVLLKNLNGLRSLLMIMGDEQALSTF